jgi:hypothetical protein
MEIVHRAAFCCDVVTVFSLEADHLCYGDTIAEAKYFSFTV